MTYGTENETIRLLTNLLNSRGRGMDGRAADFDRQRGQLCVHAGL